MMGFCPYIKGSLKESECHHDGYCSECPHNTKDDTISRRAAIDELMKRDKALRNINWYDKPFAEGECKGIDDALEIINALPSVQPERKEEKWVEKFDRIIRELGVNCAYDMPSFWCNQGKNYKVIPTKYHKGYMQALADVEKRMKGAEGCPEKKQFVF